MKKTMNYNFFKINRLKGIFFMYIALGVLLLTIFRSNLVALLFPIHTAMYEVGDIISGLLLKFVHLNGFSIDLIVNILILFTSIFIAELINKAKDKWKINSLKRWLWLIAGLYALSLLFVAITTLLVFGVA